MEAYELAGHDAIKYSSGRTILPNGKVIPLKQDNIHVKTIFRQGPMRVRVKRATFPGLVPGAVIDHAYDRVTAKPGFFTAHSWDIQGRLPVLRSVSTLKDGHVPLSWRKAGDSEIATQHTKLSKSSHRFVGMWFAHLRAIGDQAADFMESRPAVAKTVEKLLSSDDSPIQKQGKIYRYVQKRMTGEGKPSVPVDPGDGKGAVNVGDVLASGLGSELEWTLIFLAMAREAGFEQSLLLVSRRDRGPLDLEVPDLGQFGAAAAAVKIDGKWNYYDPGTNYCPFGLLSPRKEGGVPNAMTVSPVRTGLDRFRGESFLVLLPQIMAPRPMTIPFTPVQRNFLLREAVVRLSENGAADVEVTDEGSGLVDFDHRQIYAGLDDRSRKAALLKTIQEGQPGATLVSASFDDVEALERPATIRYRLAMPNLASVAGDGLIVPVSVFRASRPNPFTAETRRSPVHFPHTAKTVERITFEIPEGFVPSDLPGPTMVRDGPFFLATLFEEEPGRLVFSRRVEVDTAQWPVEVYGQLREFFGKVWEADRQTIVLVRKPDRFELPPVESLEPGVARHGARRSLGGPRPMNQIPRRLWRARAALACLAVIAPALPGHVLAAKAIDPIYLSIADCPDDPGCPALALLEEIEFNNESSRTRYSYRRIIKIFTEEGIQEYSDVEVRALSGGWDVRDLSGRTILPDGTEIPLKQANISVKYLRQGKRRVRVKSANFPGVVPGAIIDYSYDILTEPNTFVTDDTWFVQSEIPVLQAKYTLKHGKFPLSWKESGMGVVDISHRSPFGNVNYFEAKNVPKMPEEPFGPPRLAVRARMHLFLPQQQGVWLGALAAVMADSAGEFIEKTPGVAQKASELVLPEDPPLTKVKKIYAFVQQKIGTERQRASETEETKVKDAANAGEVLERGFGGEYERTLLFLALVKEVGLEHGLLLLAGRSTSYFDRLVPDNDQFDSFAAAVKTGANWTFYDPAARHCPFGMISAEKEGGDAPNGILVVPTKGAAVPKQMEVNNLLIRSFAPFTHNIATLPFSSSSKNMLTREARLSLSTEGSIELDVSEQGTGFVDMEHREAYEDLDEEERKEALTGTLHEALPQAEVVSVSFEDIASFEKNAKIKYQLRLPATVQGTADRILLFPSIFHAGRPNPFSTPNRLTPVHFPYRKKTQERIKIEIPEGYELEKLPTPTVIRDAPLALVMSYSWDEDGLVFSRGMDIDAAVWPVADYARLRSFFEKVQEADRQVIEFRRSAAP